MCPFLEQGEEHSSEMVEGLLVREFGVVGAKLRGAIAVLETSEGQEAPETCGCVE